MRGWFPRFVALGVTVILSLMVVWGCGGSRPAAVSDADEAARREAEVIEREYQLERDDQVLAQGEALLAADPRHARGGHITTLMIRSALRSSRVDRARDLALVLPERWPGAAGSDEVMMATARALAEQGRSQDALRVASVLASSQPAGAGRDFTVTRAAAWLEDLTARELALWVAGQGPLAPAAGLASVRRALASANLEGAQQQLSTLERDYPTAPATGRARQELTAALARLERVASGRLGVLCPLTGRYARFGNAFLQGVRLATEHVPVDEGPGWTLLFEDTQADPVLAALHARELCADEGCGLLLGGLLSSTTATAALVAADHDVSLISPTATSERLSMLGDHVLQTNQTGPLEAELLARLACEVLLKRRFAIIRPATPEGESMALAFATKVEELGGEIVGEQIIDPASTDFRAEVRALRELRCEVVFAPTSADQMTLLGPQLDFFKVGALVLGPSAWNSQRLLNNAGTVMERAVFVASEVAYPMEWTVDFTAEWPAADYDEETTAVGRSAYLAARLALTTLVEDPLLAAADVSRRMQDALTGQQAEAGPEAYGATVRMVQDGVVVPFPGELYTVAWQREQAMADSLAAMADSLGLVTGDTLLVD